VDVSRAGKAKRFRWQYDSEGALRGTAAMRLRQRQGAWLEVGEGQRRLLNEGGRTVVNERLKGGCVVARQVLGYDERGRHSAVVSERLEGEAAPAEGAPAVQVHRICRVWAYSPDGRWEQRFEDGRCGGQWELRGLTERDAAGEVVRRSRFVGERAESARSVVPGPDDQPRCEGWDHDGDGEIESLHARVWATDGTLRESAALRDGPDGFGARCSRRVMLPGPQPNTELRFESVHRPDRFATVSRIDRSRAGDVLRRQVWYGKVLDRLKLPPGPPYLELTYSTEQAGRCSTTRAMASRRGGPPARSQSLEVCLDSQGRVAVTRRQWDGPAVHETRFEYDEQGALVGMTEGQPRSADRCQIDIRRRGGPSCPAVTAAPGSLAGDSYTLDLPDLDRICQRL